MNIFGGVVGPFSRDSEAFCLLSRSGLPEGELTTGEERRKEEGELSSLISRDSTAITLCGVPVLRGREGFSQEPELMSDAE